MRKAVNILWGLALVCLLATGVLATEEYEYTLQEDTAVLTRYIGWDTNVTVPASITVDGVRYKTVLDSKTVFRNNENLQSVTLATGVGFLEQSAEQLFMKCRSLKSVQLGNVTGLTSMCAMFRDCEKLVQLDLSGVDTSRVTDLSYLFCNCKGLSQLTGYESWQTGAVENMYMTFVNTGSLKTVDLSRWDLSNVKNTGWCFQNSGATQVLLPDSLAVISAGFFNHLSGYAEETFTLPKGVKRVGYGHTFYDFGSYFTQFQVAEGNDAYQAVNGILYSADGTELLAIPRNKTFPDGVFTVPQGVTFMGELSFSRNYNVKELILPDSFEIRVVDANDERYIIHQDKGNLNGGNSLSIAIYSYTGITRYGVRDTNPRYKAVDGVLYTKDGVSLVAVPTRYDGYIAVPEGTVRWEREAMWGLRSTIVDSYMSKSTGVSIPKSMTWIADEQLDKLNRLAEAYCGFTITVDPENPAYRLDENGQLVARLAVSALRVQLSEESYVYDGTEKKPQITVWDGDTCLVLDQDYTFSYENNVRAGTAAVCITGLGEYGGTVWVPFKVEKAPMEQTPAPTVRAYYGQCLRELILPEEYEWVSDSVVGAVGEKHFPAVRKSEDPNYRDSQVQIPVQVEPRPVGVVITVKSKSFDFTGQAEYTAQLMGTLSGERVALDSSTVLLTYTSIWPGEQIPVTVEGEFLLTGEDAGNYILCKPEEPLGAIQHNYVLLGVVLGGMLMVAGVLFCHRRKKRKQI